jgi:hypothetical protein
LLAATLWVSRYWYSAEFGLYEDDYTRTPRAMSASLPELAHLIGENFTRLSEHGKVLQAPLLDMFSFLGAQLGGLRGLYGLGFALTVLTVWLFYAWLRRLASPAFALVGGLAFGLFCADTTQAWLTRSFGLQPALILLLLAFHTYFARRKALAYLLAGLILVVYETPFPVFFAAPLLETTWDRKWLKAALTHGLILTIILGVVIGVRWLAGESRVGGLDGAAALLTPLAHMLSGPLTSLKMMLSRPYQAARHLKPEMLSALLVSFPVLTAALWASYTGAERLPGASLARRWAACQTDARPLGRLALFGLAALILAYPLTFTIDPHIADGRDARVHLAAVVGVAVLLACAGTLALLLAQRFLRKIVAASILAAYFALLLAYGFVIQGDYALAWQMQRQFWSQLAPLVGDAADGTVILVEPSVPRATGQIGVITWSTPRVLAQLYHFPVTWQNPPRVYRLEPGWEQTLAAADGQFQINGQNSFIPEAMFVTLPSTNVIFLETGAGRLFRRTDPLVLNGQEYPLRQPLSAGEPPFVPTPLHQWLLFPGK